MVLVENSNISNILKSAEPRPYVTGSSVIALKFKNGVMIVSDTLGSYNSVARYSNVLRTKRLSDTAVLCGSGDIADLQAISGKMRGKILKQKELNDGYQMTPQEIFSSVSQILYKKRHKMSPYLNSLVIAGVEDKDSFIGVVDPQGTSFSENFVATGFGIHLAIPILREEWHPNLTETAAKELLMKCITVLFCRDSMSLNRFVLVKLIRSDRSPQPIFEESKPFSVNAKWDFKGFIDDKNGWD